MEFKTADLCDRFADALQIADPGLRDFGAVKTFAGPIVTLKVFEDNSMIRTTLEQPGHGRVLVVDGGGSTHCSLVGEPLARLALDNGWKGLVINGCVRHIQTLAEIPIGIKALAVHPRHSTKKGSGEHDIPLRFVGLYFVSGEYLYADPDGLLIARSALI